MDSSCILALDQGTTSCRAILFNRYGKIIWCSQKEITQYFPYSGWVEHNAEEIWATQLGTIYEALVRAQRSVEDIVTIGITNQRETTVLWDRETSKPLYNAIVWQDRRTTDYCESLKSAGYEEIINKKTGLPIDPYFSASKLKWMLDNVPDARKKAEQGKLAFGTIDSWLVWNLTQRKKHVTDITNASRTSLFNIETQTWDDDLLKIFDIPRSLLPEVCGCSEIVGEWSASGSTQKIPISGIAGDQHAALFGQLCIKPGMAKNTYGTGCFVMLNTGDKLIRSSKKLVTTIAWKIGDQINYALEGSIFIGGAVVQWLRDKIKIINNAADIENLAKAVMDEEEKKRAIESKLTTSSGNDEYCIVVPAFVGLGAPHWEPRARGAMFGITRNSSSAHVAKAALESIAYQSCDVLNAMATDVGYPITELRVDGGAATNNLLMQFQADMLNQNVIRPKITETTALGAAYLAGLAVKYWPDIQSLHQQWQQDHCFSPKINDIDRNRRLSAWHRALKATIYWSNLNEE